MRHYIRALALVAGLASGSPALAAELGAESAASFTITVNIPPIAAALAAQSEGAVGLWTVGSDKSALMIKLPDTVQDDQTFDGAIFYTGNTMFEVSAENSLALAVSRTLSLATNGLVRQGLALRPTKAAAGSTSVTMVVAAV